MTTGRTDKKMKNYEKYLNEGIGYELYSKGADRVAIQTKQVKDLAEKLADATRKNKSLNIRKKLLKDLKHWVDSIQGEVKTLISDAGNLEGYKE